MRRHRLDRLSKLTQGAALLSLGALAACNSNEDARHVNGPGPQPTEPIHVNATATPQPSESAAPSAVASAAPSTSVAHPQLPRVNAPPHINAPPPKE